ncbi:MAG: UDP-N-acetylmuramoyl-L-alanine--D-glutamate ligase [Gammaproteobacteria bacterium]|nr:UDP-N-acetylmuramoyl-L-alanine--D-glutamate ligase [Gammaproteobacteria bacterium]
MKHEKVIIIGLGQTGISVARFLAQKNIDFSVCDTRDSVTNLADFQAEFPDVLVCLGKLDPELLKSATQLIVSPGVAISTPAIAEAQQAGVEIIGDIELFVRHCAAPIIAITGSNGKTTTTTLVSEMAKASGFRVGMGGNIGTPALDLLTSDYNFFVLELSSFQLETTTSLRAAAAVCLNVSDNHMDRYNHFQEYVAAKNTIYHDSKISVINLDDPPAWETATLSKNKIGFTVKDPEVGRLMRSKPKERLLASHKQAYRRDSENQHCFSLINNQLCYDGEAWLAIADLPIKTKHHCANLLAAFALGSSCNFKKEAMLYVATSFVGIPHRCQTVAEKNGVMWINDSKATTIAAATVAIENIGATITGKIILIAGGDGKGANFTPFAKPISEYCRAVILLGRDAEQISAILPNSIKPIFLKTLAEAVTQAAILAEAGDAVLLSPACASTDMFKNFVERGELFIKYVKQMK